METLTTVCVCLYLSKLPGNTDGPAQAIASNEEGLHTPAPEMAKCKNVKMAQDSLPRDDMAVHSIFLQPAAQRASLQWLIIPWQWAQLELENQWEHLSSPWANITHHDVRLSLGISQVRIQPVHELLHLLPVEEDDQNQEQEVEHTETYQRQ